MTEVHLLILKHWLEGGTLSGVEAGGYSALPLCLLRLWAPSLPSSSPKRGLHAIPLLASRSSISRGSFYLRVVVQAASGVLVFQLSPADTP